MHTLTSTCSKSIVLSCDLNIITKGVNILHLYTFRFATMFSSIYVNLPSYQRLSYVILVKNLVFNYPATKVDKINNV